MRNERGSFPLRIEPQGGQIEFSGRYSVILADPANTSAELSTVRLKSNDGDKTVEEIAEANALLFLWSTAERLTESIEILEAWGFHYETVRFRGSSVTGTETPFLGRATGLVET